MAWRIAGAVALPLFVAAYLTSLLGPDAPSWAALLVILAGLAVAGAGMYLVLRGMLRETPEPPVSDRARAAGRRWDAEIAERQRRREAGEEDDE
jgi:hypothetical protein